LWKRKKCAIRVINQWGKREIHPAFWSSIVRICLPHNQEGLEGMSTTDEHLKSDKHLSSVEHKLEIESAAELLDGVGVIRPEIEDAVRGLLMAFGEDVSREGLGETPSRVARMYDELLAGYRIDPHRLINDAIFNEDYNEMVIVRNIEFYSMCEHHMLPFIGQAHVAYLPHGKVIGLSKIPRVVDLFSRRLQVQERMTRQIADFLETALHPHGVAVVVEGLHLCSMMRGVKKANARMVTSALCGTFSENEVTRKEFLDHIARASSSGIAL
jgi:GTP cyclohydrolase I